MIFHRLWLALLFGLCVGWTHAELRDVVIMQTTDMHGVFEEEDDSQQNGSWLRIATMVKRIRQREEGKCILVDCGDNAQGTLATALSRGMAGIIPLKTMKYDVWVPGNHELDYWERHLDDACSFLAGIEPGTKNRLVLGDFG